MSAMRSWTVSDALWERVEPLIPPPRRARGRAYQRKPGGGRKPLPPRQVFEAIVYVLRTGIQWKAVPKAVFGSPSSIHKYFLAWKRAGVFGRLWRQGLAEYDDLEGIAWAWQRSDTGTGKAPLAQEAVGPTPTDRGKTGDQAPRPGRRPWNPAVDTRRRGEPA